MNDIILITSLGERIPAKATDAELKLYEQHGVKFELIGKTEKPDVLKKEPKE